MDYGYNTTYGAQGGSGGGGFFAGSQGDTGGASVRSEYGQDTLRPLTIKQIVDSPIPPSNTNDKFQVDGSDLTQITFVGQIRNISQQATNYTYKFDDGTGTIEVKQWIDPDSMDNDGGAGGPPDGKGPKLAENMYARVWGRLKAFNNKKHVGAHVIRPITDMNEVQYHLLEATAVHLFFTRGPPGGGSGDQKGMNGGGTMQVDGYGNDGADSGGSRQIPAGLSGAARRMFACLQTSPQSNEGLHVHDIATKSGLDVSAAMAAADELGNHGMVYTTVDDQTFAILEDL